MIENNYKDPNYIDLGPYKNDIIRLYTHGMSARKIASLLRICGADKILRSLRRWRISTYKKGYSNKGNSKAYKKIPYSFFTSFIKSAMRRNLSFNITIEEIWEIYLYQGGICALSGEILKFDTYRSQCDGNASLDRKNNTKGYSKNNCQLVCKDINIGKGLLTDEQYIELCRKVTKYNDRKQQRLGNTISTEERRNLG